MGREENLQKIKSLLKFVGETIIVRPFDASDKEKFGEMIEASLFFEGSFPAVRNCRGLYYLKKGDEVHHYFPERNWALVRWVYDGVSKLHPVKIEGY